MHSWENDDVLSGGPLNHIHQNTKSARLIAMCERSLILNFYFLWIFCFVLTVLEDPWRNAPFLCYYKCLILILFALLSFLHNFTLYYVQLHYLFSLVYSLRLRLFPSYVFLFKWKMWASLEIGTTWFMVWWNTWLVALNWTFYHYFTQDLEVIEDAAILLLMLCGNILHTQNIGNCFWQLQPGIDCLGKNCVNSQEDPLSKSDNIYPIMRVGLLGSLKALCSVPRDEKSAAPKRGRRSSIIVKWRRMFSGIFRKI